MLKKTIYKIHIKSWDKYNGTLKRGHKKIMISTGFLSDAKIRTLSPGGKLLYLGLLLCCGEHTSNLIECSHDHLVMLTGGRGHDVSMLLDQLQSLQLLTYEKIAPNRIEKNRKEDNRIEKNSDEASGNQKKPDQPEQESFPETRVLSVRSSKAVSRGCIDEFSHDPICQERLANVTTRAQKGWLAAYPSVDFILMEIRRAHGWIETNPQKCPKDFGKFMVNWLSRAFETYRKGIPTKHKSAADKAEDHLQKLRDQVDRGEI